MTFHEEDLFGRFRPFTVGMDRFFDELTSSSIQNDNYPPYNIIKIDSETFAIELAVAGMSKTDIHVTKEKSQLIVKGDKGTPSEDEMLHKGIATRNFTKTFTLAEDVQIDGATVVNGILRIDLKRVIPEEDKPVEIKIK
jgi:molecular chaperone IbpA|tara:strand:- start:1945 stop:2361 length:417 start_codon:yes stop_codon:yes gene_type:complete